MLTLRTILVVVHASAGFMGLAVGWAALSPPAATDRRAWLRRLYMGSVVVMLGSMVALVVSDWPGLATGTRVAFGALTVLGGVIACRLAWAQRLSRTQDHGWRARYIGHMYFTYVSLWIGFLVVPALAGPAPGLSIPAMVVTVLLVGHRLVGRYQQRVLSQAPGLASTTRPEPTA